MYAFLRSWNIDSLQSEPPLVNSLCFVCTWLSLGALQVLVFKLAHVFLFLNAQRKKGWEERGGVACALHFRFCTVTPQNKCLSFVSLN